MTILDRITTVPFGADQYVDVDSPKSMIFIHHTASSANPFGVVDWWKSTAERVATSFIVAGHPGTSTKWKDGDIIQCFSSSKWAYHLGLTQAHLAIGGPKALGSVELNRRSIGIEICNWGQLTKTAKGFVAYSGVAVPDNQVHTFETPFRGYKHYQKYTPAQLDTTFQLLRYLGEKWNIPVAYKGDRIFDLCPECIQGEPGVWTHVSCRPDKFDCFPQPDLITMLKSL
jgi:N-acetyl-anhydromuramyl-L-alanine amidase AmpD